MNKKLIVLLVFIFPFSLVANDLIKVGVYDFDRVIESMTKEPSLRVLLPEVLNENLFILKMLKGEFKLTKSSARSVEEKIEFEVKRQYLDSLYQSSLSRSDSARKSGKMKKYLISGIYAARNYFGFNLILKPSDHILYQDSSILSSSIASALAEYLDKQKKKSGQEIIDEVSNSDQV